MFVAWVPSVVTAIVATVWYVLWGGPAGEAPARAGVGGSVLGTLALLPPFAIWVLHVIGVSLPPLSEVQQELRVIARAVKRAARRLCWVGLVAPLVVAATLVVGDRAPDVVTGGATRDYFKDDEEWGQVRDIFRDKKLDVRVFRLSGAEQAVDAADPQSAFTFYLAPNSAIKEQILKKLGGPTKAKAAPVYETQMVIATYRSVRQDLLAWSDRRPAPERLAQKDARGYVRFNTAAYEQLVNAAASNEPGKPAAAKRWGDILGPSRWKDYPLKVVAPSPCYAGGGWAHIAMLSQAIHERQARKPDNRLHADLDWLYGARSGGTTTLRSDDVRDQWITASNGPAYLTYESDALDVLARVGRGQRRPDAQTGSDDPGVLMYPYPSVDATHWLVIRTGDDAADRLFQLLTGSSSEARDLRHREAKRFAVRYPGNLGDDQLAGSFAEYLRLRLGGGVPAVFPEEAGEPQGPDRTESDGSWPADLAIQSQVGYLHCYS